MALPPKASCLTFILLSDFVWRGCGWRRLQTKSAFEDQGGASSIGEHLQSSWSEASLLESNARPHLGKRRALGASGNNRNAASKTIERSQAVACLLLQAGGQPMHPLRSFVTGTQHRCLGPVASLPSGWREVASENGDVYYYNDASGVSQWEKPVLVPVDPLSSGWREVMSDSGQPYYYNEASGTSQWERPAKKFQAESANLASQWERPAEKFQAESANLAQKEKERNDQLAQDLAKFKQLVPNVDEEMTLLEKVSETLGNILSVNFVIILGFFSWLVLGVIFRYTVQVTQIIDGFLALWDWLILPLLSTHLALTLLAWVLEKAASVQKSAAKGYGRR